MGTCSLGTQVGICLKHQQCFKHFIRQTVSFSGICQTAKAQQTLDWSG